MSQKFHNPYGFIPAPPRNDQHETLGDKQPAGHDRYKADHWSGCIEVCLTTETPLLVLDAAKAQRDAPTKGHNIFPTRIGVDGSPYIPPTSIKGMLRSAFEAVTNSRISVLAEHDRRLAFRSPASEGLKMVPARVDGNNIELLFGTNIANQIDNSGSPKKWNDVGRPGAKNSVMHAAWIERHPDFGNLDNLHQKKVWAFITLWRHSRPDFDFWNVVEIRDENDKRPRPVLEEQRWNFGRSAMLRPPDIAKRLPADPGYQPGKWVQGYLCVTGKNIDRKHDERLFFGKPVLAEGLPPQQMQSLRNEWKLLIEDYERSNREHGSVDPNIDPSQHILNAEHVKNLPSGTLCYAAVQGNGRGGWQWLLYTQS